MRSWLSVVIFVAACGNDVGVDMTGGGDDGPMPDPDQCTTSYLGYDNFGAPFMSDWCRGCHGSAVPEMMRQKAPMDVNFDTLAEVQSWQLRIQMRATVVNTMPPAGGPSEEERLLLAEWLECGAP